MKVVTPLALLVVGSIALRTALGFATPAPTIFPDELVYTELSRRLALSGALPPWSFGPLYPLLIAPVFALVHDASDAYLVVKLVNGVLMSSAAIPAYLLGRRLLSTRGAIFFAATTLLIPSLVYSTKVMTESAAYPLFLWSALSMLRAVEAPTRGRQLQALAVIVTAAAVRPQMIVLVFAFLTAVVFWALMETDAPARSALVSSFHRHRPSLVSLGALGALAVLGLAAGALSGHAPSLQRGDVSPSHLDLLAVPRLFLYHVAELDFAAGVIPFVCLALLVRDVRRLPRRVRLYVVTASSICAWILLLVAAYATQPLPETRIYERYTFYLIPLLVLALLVWIEQGLVRRAGAWLVIAPATALPLAIPLDSLRDNGSGVLTSALGLLPLRLLLLGFDSTLPVYGILGVALAALGVLVARTTSTGGGWLRLTLITYLFVVGLAVTTTQVALGTRSSDLGAGRPAATWIDDRVGATAEVAAIWSGTRDGGWHSGYPIWNAAFFNRSVGRIYTLRSDFGLLAGTQLSLEGGLATAGGRPVTPAYVLADPLTIVTGTPIAHDSNTGMTLYRIRGPLHVRIVRVRCAGRAAAALKAPEPRSRPRPAAIPSRR